MDADDLAKGLVAGLLMDQVGDRGRLAIGAGLAVGAVALVGAVFTGGVLRWLLVLLVLVALGVAAAAWLVRRVALATIRRFAEPRDVAGHRQAIDHAIDRADLPTGPLAVARTLWRLTRGGPGAEVDRLRKVLADLRTELTETS